MPPELTAVFVRYFFRNCFKSFRIAKSMGWRGGALKEKQKAVSQSKLYISFSFESPPIFSLFLVVVLFSTL